MCGQHRQLLLRILSSHRRQTHAVRTTTDASILTETAIINKRPRTVDHNSGTSPSTSDAAAVLDPVLSVSVAAAPSLAEPGRSSEDLRGSGTCHDPSGWSSDFDIAESNQSTLNAPSYKYRRHASMIRIYCFSLSSSFTP